MEKLLTLKKTRANLTKMRIIRVISTHLSVGRLTNNIKRI